MSPLSFIPFVISASEFASNSMWNEPHIRPSDVNWRRFNQRQNRKNRRRAHAAGKRNAFTP